MLFIAPLLLATLIWSAFSTPIARDLPIGYVDNDNSQISRELLRYYDASPSLTIANRYNSVYQASIALKKGEIYAYVVIPYRLEKDTKLGKSPQVSAFYNSQFILVGKLVSSAIIAAHTTYVTQVEVFSRLLTQSSNPNVAIGDALPIQTQITPLFNSNSHYGQFLIAAIIPALWQIMIIATTVLALASPVRSKGLENWLKDISFRQVLIRFIPYIAIFLLQGILFLTTFYSLLNWPMHGSWVLLITAQLLLILACISLATLFFVVILDATRTMSIVAAFSAPAFAFLGVTFPATDMPLLAQIWRSLLPASHYMKIQIQQVNYGISFHESINEYTYLMCFTVSLLLAKIILSKRKKDMFGKNLSDEVSSKEVNS